mgnify:FL=1
MAFAFSPQAMDRAKAYFSRSMEMEKETMLQKLRLEKCRLQMDCLPGQESLDEQALAHQLQARRAALMEGLQKWLETEEEIKSTIRALPDGMQRTVLEMRYVHQIPYFDIAEKLHMDERHIYRVHRKALQLAAVILADQGKITA